MSTVISIEHVSKSYRLGQIGSGTLREDLQSWWHRMRGRPDPNLRVDLAHRVVEGHTLWALQDVSLTVGQGEVLGIIGRNGAGKSTLLKILSRVTAPTSGRIRVKGRVASLLEVGTGFHPELTGRENVFLNGAILGMTKAEVARKFDEIVAFSEIEPFIDTPVKRYSSGMYVRLAFAVAAHLEPEILVVDEVLAVGDSEFQRKCIAKMGSVARTGRTVLFVSHNMLSIQALCSRAVLLQDGRAVECGPTDGVVARYMQARELGAQARGEADLTDHPGRVANLSVEKALRRIKMEDAAGQIVDAIPMGGRLRILFDFECSRPVRNPGFGIGVDDHSGTRMFSLNNYMCPAPDNTFDRLRRGRVCIDIPEVPLLPGRYSLRVALTQDNDQWVDCIDQAVHFDVVAADVFKSGRIPDRSQGIVFAEGTVTVSGGA